MSRSRHIVIALLLTLSLPAFTAPSIQPRIIGGTESEPDRWPYMTALMNRILGITVAGISYEATYLIGSPAKLFSGTLVDCGLASEPCAGVRGRICLILRGNNTFAEKVSNCAAGGGIGAIIYNNEPGNFLGTLQRAVTTIPAVSISQADGMALLQRVGEYASFGYSGLTPSESFCGATWIGDVWVLTAAHCVADVEPHAMMVNVGGHDLRYDQDNVIGVTDVLVHNDYDPTTITNDIALLRLEHAPTGVTPVAIASPEQLDRAVAQRRDVVMLGRGQQDVVAPGEDAPPTPVVYELYEVSVPLVDNTTCGEAIDAVLYPGSHRPSGIVTDTMVCAGRAEGGVGTCFGDSGGPMILFDDGVPYLGGITSWGIGCGYPGLYDVMTRVPAFKTQVETAIKARERSGNGGTTLGGSADDDAGDDNGGSDKSPLEKIFGGALSVWLLIPLWLAGPLLRQRRRTLLPLITVIVTTLPACQPMAAAMENGPATRMHKLEPLQAINIDRNGVEITVVSTGCTSTGDFRLSLQDQGDLAELAIYRIRPDHCRRTPRPVTLTLPWNDETPFPQKRLRIRNPISGAAER